MKIFKSSRLVQVLHLFVFLLITAAANAQLRANFGADNRSGCPPMVVSFTDSSIGDPTTYEWDLGNGTISFSKNPVATYFNSGKYTIKLIISNEFGSDTIVKKDFIVVNPLPVPNFGVSDSTGCFPLRAAFIDSTNTTSGNIVEWQWDFGEGTLSNEQNPVYVYRSAGSYNVTLKVTNSDGCTQVIRKPGFIKVSNGVVADFSYTSADGCESPAPVTFNNKSTGTGTLSYLWDFGNGQTSTEKNPLISYADAGVYTVKMIASNDYGCTDTLVKPNAINIGFVKAGFTNPDTVCAVTTFQLTNTSNPPSFVKSTWYFGNGDTSTNPNPSYSYKKGGEYEIKLVVDFGSCRDSVVNKITVLDGPAADFTSTNNLGCTPPLTVSFTNTTTNAESYEWNFGDGTTSTEQNPEHTYTNAGQYTVTLNAKNAAGCVATVVKSNFVKIVAPKITGFTGLSVKGCLPLVVKPTAIIEDTISAITGYVWNFGDGSTSKSAKPSHTYTKAGNFTVTLTITTALGCSTTYAMPDAVKAGNKPEADFTADPREVCAFTPVTFTDQTKNVTVHEWFWSFGDGGTTAEKKPAHNYGDTGYFKVSLVVYNFGCSDTVRKENFIHVNPPIANFDTSFLCSEPLRRNFINKSIGGTAWEWNFGDGTSSNLKDPTHTYTTTGTYQVALKVKNGACEHVQQKNVVIVKEQAKLDISNTESCINSNLTFNVTNVNPANIINYKWFFNGLSQPSTTTTSNTVSATYTTAGTRTPAVIITDLLRCTDTMLATVPIMAFGPKVGFTASPQGACLGSVINLTDTSKGDGIHPIQSWTWTYGEGTRETFNTATTVAHTYPAIGEYDITLVVADSYGCKDSITKPMYISITKPVATFTPSDTSICPASKITFTNQSQGLGATYSWDFGDGTTSNAFSPVHQYAQPGSYVAKLTMVDKNNCTDSYAVPINIYTAKAEFSLSDTFSTCPPLTVNATNQSSNFLKHTWNFGDGSNSELLNPSHIYSYPGNYTVTLTVTNNGGCTDKQTKNVRILGPTGTLSYSPKEACLPAKVDMSIQSQNGVKYVWDFNDGNTIFSASPQASHTYTRGGEFIPRAILEDARGCKVAISGKDTIKVRTIQTNIVSNEKLLCDSGSISFSDSTITNDALGAWSWNFGDGTTSNQRNPTHKFADTGFYTISLTTTTRFGCTSTATNANYIKVVNSPNVKIVGDTSACEPAQLAFAGNFATPDTSAVRWSWNFANGQTSTLQQPPAQNYPAAGNYPVNLSVTNSSNCLTVVTRQAIIHPKPVISAGTDAAICLNNDFKLQATGADTYTWAQHPSLSCTNCAAPTVKPTLTTTYTVTGTTRFGCTNIDSVTVEVKQPFTMTVAKGDTLCKGESFVLNASGTDKYEWTPSMWLNNPSSATPTSKPENPITYKVVGSDNLNCFSDTGFVTLQVYPKPQIEITNGENITVQVGSTATLGTKKSADVTTLKWYPQNWISCVNCDEPQIAPQGNITYNVVATNQGNCQSFDKITVNVLCNNENVFIPNTFSPNGDGNNDVFFPRGKGLYNIKSFRVFNRLGQIVFAKDAISPNDPSDGWDGTIGGVPAHSDVYVYVLEVVCTTGTVFPYKGNVTLIR